MKVTRPLLSKLNFSDTNYVFEFLGAKTPSPLTRDQYK